MSRFVDVGADFEEHRGVVELVSVLFELFDGDAASYAATGSPGVKLPTGWVVSASKFEVEWPTDSVRCGLVRSHFGARRAAFNWGLARVKADLDAKAVDPEHQSLDWDLGSLRQAWNGAKDEVAPWWAVNSKEAYSAGLADLARALRNWSSSKNGSRKGRRVGFPRFCAARRDPGRVRFTTGTMRVEPDRHTITVPVTPCRLEGKGRIDKHLLCSITGQVVDRDRNAALNLRDWPDTASCGPVGTTAPTAPVPTTTVVGTVPGADTTPGGAGGVSVRARTRGTRRGEAKTPTPHEDAA